MDRSAAQATRTFCSIGHGRVSFHKSEFTLYIEQGHERADLCEDRILKAKIAPLRVCTHRVKSI